MEISAAVFDNHEGRRFDVAQFLDLTQHKKTQAAWQESEERYRLVTDHSLTGIYLVQHGKYLYVNPRFAQIMGCEAQEIIGRDFWWQVHPEDRETVKSRGLARARGEAGVPSHYEYRIVRGDGQIAWLEILANTIELQGELVNMGNVVDVTGRKITEQALVESEYRFRCLQEATFGGIAIHDQGLILDANEALCEISGYTRDELIGMDGLGLIAPRWRKLVRGNIQSGYGLAYQVEGLRKDGAIYPLEIRGKNMPYRGIQARVTEFRDVTLLKKTEQALEKSEQRFATALKASPQWIAITTQAEGRFVEVNQACAAISGFTRQEVLGRTALELGLWLDPNDRASLLRRLKKEGNLRNVEVQWRMKDGRIRSMLLSADPMDWDGQPCLINALTDITDLKQIQQELSASEEKYRSVMEAACEPMVVYDLEGKTQYINPAFTRVFGWTAQELLGAKLKFVPKEEEERALRKIEHVLREGYSSGYETRRFTKDGRLLDVSISAATYKDSEGKVRGTVVNLRDITQGKKQERELRLSEARLQHMIELAGDWFWEMDADLRFTEVSQKFFSGKNAVREKILGRTVEQCFRPEILLCEPARWQGHVDDLKAHRPINDFEFGFLTGRKKPFYMSVSGVPLFDQAGNFTGYRGSGNEITDRVLANLELEASAGRLQKILDHSPIGVGICRVKDGVILYANEQLEQMCGAPLKGKSVHDHWVDPSQRDWFLGHFAAHGFVRGTPARMLRADGSKHWCILSWTKIEYTGEESIVHWAYDIDELKATQEALQKAHDELEEKVRERTAELEQSRSNFVQAFHESHAWMSITDMDTGRFVEVNQAYCRGLGRTREELIGKTTVEAGIWPTPQDRLNWLDAVHSKLKSKSSSILESDLLHKDGSVHTVTGSAGVMHWGGKQVFVSTAIDVTEQKKAQAALFESQQKYRTILDNTGTATVIIAENALITYANPEYERLAGYGANEVAGKVIWNDNVHPDDLARMVGYARKRREKGEPPPRSYEFRLVTRSGAVKNILVTVAMLPGTQQPCGLLD